MSPKALTMAMMRVRPMVHRTGFGSVEAMAYQMEKRTAGRKVLCSGSRTEPLMVEQKGRKRVRTMAWKKEHQREFRKGIHSVPTTGVTTAHPREASTGTLRVQERNNH